MNLDDVELVLFLPSTSTGRYVSISPAGPGVVIVVGREFHTVFCKFIQGAVSLAVVFAKVSYGVGELHAPFSSL